jgi:thiol:disulfide interchange protein DsbA
MFKKPLLLTAYTLLVIVISALITTVYFHYFVLNKNGTEETLKSVSVEEAKNSPIKDKNTIVEVFSYGCHYCAVSENDIAKLEARMPAGTKFVRLHISNPANSGLATFAPLFATLTVMGIEPQHRASAYKTVIKDNIDLGETEQRNKWLQANGIDVNEYQRVSQSQEVKDLLGYMVAVSKYYKINATPTFIVGQKWLAQQDREYPKFADQLLSLLQQDKPLEK